MTLNNSILTTCGIILVGTLTSRGEIKLLTGDSNNHVHPSNCWVQDISADGDLVLFFSDEPPAAANTPGITLGGLYERRISTNTLKYVGDPKLTGFYASFSDDGRYLTWRGLEQTIYWCDSKTNVTRLINPSSDGACYRPIMSADGRYIAYASAARNLVTNTSKLQPAGNAGVYLYDNVTKKTTVVSLNQAGNALDTGIGSVVAVYNSGNEFDFSADGKFIIFSSDARNVDPEFPATYPAGLTCIYRRNLSTGAIDILNTNASGKLADGGFSGPRISADGARMTFNGAYVGLYQSGLMIDSVSNILGVEAYAKDANTNKVWWVTKTIDNSVSGGVFSAAGAISGDGKTVAFVSTGTSFVDFLTDDGDPTGGYSDIFRVDLASDGTVKTSLITTGIGGNVIPFGEAYLPYNGEYIAFTTQQPEAMIKFGPTDFSGDQGFSVKITPPEPEIVVQQPLKKNINDKDSKNFGPIIKNTTSVKTFTIKNIGTAKLTGLAINITGKHKNDYKVSAPLRKFLNPGGTTTFKVTFKPSALNIRKADIHISSNDADENPFNINLLGTGIAP